MQRTALRTVLVDDEPIARRVLEEELSDIQGIIVVGQAESGSQAVEVIKSLRPDLVLLDIQMPVCGGFEVVRRLSPLPPAVIFVTAYDHYAVRAFEVSAADYLLKPVRRDRLRAAIEKVRSDLRHRAQTAETLARTLDAVYPNTGRRIFGRKGDEYFLLSLDDVLAFCADGELVWIVTKQQRYLASHTLRAITKRLEGSQFRRIRRSTLINMEHISKMSRLSSRRWLVTMSNDLKLTVSKSQSHTMREVLHA